MNRRKLKYDVGKAANSKNSPSTKSKHIVTGVSPSNH